MKNLDFLIKNLHFYHKSQTGLAAVDPKQLYTAASKIQGFGVFCRIVIKAGAVVLPVASAYTPILLKPTVSDTP